jgi:hypothetical protein
VNTRRSIQNENFLFLLIDDWDRGRIINLTTIKNIQGYLNHRGQDYNNYEEFKESLIQQGYIRRARAN